MAFTAGRSLSASERVGVWLACLLLSVAIFSAFFGSIAFIVLRVTMIFAFPVWLLCLPFVIAFKDAEQRRGPAILVGGSLIGPVSLVFWGLVLQLRGGDVQMVWIGDGLDQGIFSGMVYAAVVGALMSALYVAALRILHGWPIFGHKVGED